MANEKEAAGAGGASMCYEHLLISSPSMEHIRKLIELTARKEEVFTMLNEVKEQIAGMHPAALSYMQDNGLNRVTADGYTVYLKRNIRASFKGTPEAFAMVEENGLHDALTTTINPQRASSIVREQVKGLEVDEAIPEWLKVAFSIFDEIEPGIRKA